MRLLRNISANELIKATEKLGYKVSRQVGSHLRLTTHINGQHHIEFLITIH
jgi:predicted RNA binding protein YcfA (HicA-like mRNA interferase family)